MRPFILTLADFERFFPAPGILLEHIGKATDYRVITQKQLSKTNQPEVEILVTSGHTDLKAVLPRLTGLKMISLAATGHDQIDEEYCKLNGIAVYYVPEYSSDSVAELTIGLTLAVYRKIADANTATRNGRWDSGSLVPGIELRGKTVGILGMGKIGLKSAKLFRAFGCNVIGWVRKESPGLKRLGITSEKSMEKVIRQSDILSLHLPLKTGKGGTEHILNQTSLAWLKPNALVINTARGKLIDVKALAVALKNGKLMGAGIDVYDTDPVSANHPLLPLKNVVLTPHIGYKTNEALGRLGTIAFENIGRYLNHNRHNRVNRLIP